MLFVDQLWVSPKHQWGAFLENKKQKAPTCALEKCHLLPCKGCVLHSSRPKWHPAFLECASSGKPVICQGSAVGILLGLGVSCPGVVAEGKARKYEKRGTLLSYLLQLLADSGCLKGVLQSGNNCHTVEGPVLCFSGPLLIIFLPRSGRYRS